MCLVSIKSNIRKIYRSLFFLLLSFLWTGTQPSIISPIDLKSTSNFAILTSTGITTTLGTTVQGNMGVSPIVGTSITGFGLIMDDSHKFSTSLLVSGKVYAPNYAVPTPSMLSTAISDMTVVYNDGIARINPDGLNLLYENQIFLPGLYKWTTAVTITHTISFDAQNEQSSIWIIQITKTLTLMADATVVLLNGAKPNNIFWVVSEAASMLENSHMEGIMILKTSLSTLSGSSLTGKVLAQTALTMISTSIVDANTLSLSEPSPSPTIFNISTPSPATITTPSPANITTPSPTTPSPANITTPSPANIIKTSSSN